MIIKNGLTADLFIIDDPNCIRDVGIGHVVTKAHADDAMAPEHRPGARKPGHKPTPSVPGWAKQKHSRDRRPGR